MNQGVASAEFALWWGLRRVATPALLALVVATASLLRGYALPSQGLGYWDEGLYAMEGQFLADTWLRLLHLHPDPGQPPAGYPPLFLKPAHSAMISLAMLWGGPTDLAAQVVSAVSGTLTVILVFLLGRSLYSTGTGLLAAAFLAVMPLHVTYSRLALSEANSTLLFTLAVLLYCRAERGRRGSTFALAASGLLLSLALTANYRLYVLALLFPLTELAGWALERRQTAAAFLRRNLVIAYAALLPIVATFVFFWWLQDYYQGTGLALRHPIWTFEGQIARFYGMTKNSPTPMFAVSDPLYYPYVAWTFLGPAWAIALLTAAVLLLRDRQRLRQNLLLAAWLLLPGIFYSLLSDKAPRCLAVTLPAVALVMARGVSLARAEMSSRLQSTRISGYATVAIQIALLGSGIVGTLGVVGQQGGWRPAIGYLIDLGVARAVVGQLATGGFYLGGLHQVEDVPEDPAGLLGLQREGYRYVLVDDEAYLVPKRRAIALEIERGSRAVQSFPDTLKQGPLFVLEHSEFLNLDLASTMALYEEIRQARGASEVRVYDLQQMKPVGLQEAPRPSSGEGMAALPSPGTSAP